MVSFPPPSRSARTTTFPPASVQPDGITDDVPQRLTYAHPVKVHVRQVIRMPAETVQPAGPGTAAATGPPPFQAVSWTELVSSVSLDSPWSVSASQSRSVTMPLSLSTSPMMWSEALSGAPSPSAQPLRLQANDAQRSVELVGDVVYQPPAKLALGLQGRSSSR